MRKAKEMEKGKSDKIKRRKGRKKITKPEGENGRR
jgi:hypothetical protein